MSVVVENKTYAMLLPERLERVRKYVANRNVRWRGIASSTHVVEPPQHVEYTIQLVSEHGCVHAMNEDVEFIHMPPVSRFTMVPMWKAFIHQIVPCWRGS